MDLPLSVNDAPGVPEGAWEFFGFVCEAVALGVMLWTHREIHVLKVLEPHVMPGLQRDHMTLVSKSAGCLHCCYRIGDSCFFNSERKLQ